LDRFEDFGLTKTACSQIGSARWYRRAGSFREYDQSPLAEVLSPAPLSRAGSDFVLQRAGILWNGSVKGIFEALGFAANQHNAIADKSGRHSTG